MAYDIEEQEQLESLKAWWAKYGNFILAVATIVLLAAAAWNGWQWYQRSQAANALAQFEVLEKAAEAGDLTRVKDSAGTILEQYSGTGYAPRAALLAAHAYEKAGDVRSARAQLQWVADRSGDEALAAVARLRLAGLLLDEKSYDEALNALASPPPRLSPPCTPTAGATCWRGRASGTRRARPMKRRSPSSMPRPNCDRPSN